MTNPQDNNTEIEEIVYEHDKVLAKTKLSADQKSEVLSIVNKLITDGIKLANNPDYKGTDDYTKSWDMIDGKKLKSVKRLASLCDELLEQPAPTQSIEALIIQARKDELKRLAKVLADRKPRETWKKWSWRVTDEMKERLANLQKELEADER